MKFMNEGVWSNPRSVHKHFARHVDGSDPEPDSANILMTRFDDEDAYRQAAEDLSDQKCYPIPDNWRDLERGKIYGLLSSGKSSDVRRIKLKYSDTQPSLLEVVVYSNKDDEVLAYYNAIPVKFYKNNVYSGFRGNIKGDTIFDSEKSQLKDEVDND